MTIHHHRVTVRGHFADLTDDVRARLRAEAAAHDALTAMFTPEGTFVYDRALVAFSFRYQLRVEEELREDADVAAELAGLELATATLAGRGIGHRGLRATADNLGDVWARRSGHVAGPRRPRA